jgi:hypothetical protein
LADEALTLSAIALDRFSQPILAMRRQIQQLSADNRRSHIDGAGLAKAHGAEFTRLRESVTKTADVF